MTKDNLVFRPYWTMFLLCAICSILPFKLHAAGWTATTSMPAARVFATSVVNNGYVYVIGGRANGYADMNTVYYAPFNGNGTVSAWNTTTVLPNGMEGLASAVNNGYLYVLGGMSSGPQNTVYYATINGNGTVGSWTATTSLPAARGYLTSVVNNG